jgi:hypothetical protein
MPVGGGSEASGDGVNSRPRTRAVARVEAKRAVDQQAEQSPVAVGQGDDDPVAELQGDDDGAELWSELKFVVGVCTRGEQLQLPEGYNDDDQLVNLFARAYSALGKRKANGDELAFHAFYDYIRSRASTQLHAHLDSTRLRFRVSKALDPSQPSQLSASVVHVEGKRTLKYSQVPSKMLEERRRNAVGIDDFNHAQMLGWIIQTVLGRQSDLNTTLIQLVKHLAFWTNLHELLRHYLGNCERAWLTKIDVFQTRVNSLASSDAEPDGLRHMGMTLHSELGAIFAGFDAQTKAVEHYGQFHTQLHYFLQGLTRSGRRCQSAEVLVDELKKHLRSFSQTQYGLKDMLAVDLLDRLAQVVRIKSMGNIVESEELRSARRIFNEKTMQGVCNLDQQTDLLYADYEWKGSYHQVHMRETKKPPTHATAGELLKALHVKLEDDEENLTDLAVGVRSLITKGTKREWPNASGSTKPHPFKALTPSRKRNFADQQLINKLKARVKELENAKPTPPPTSGGGRA